MKIVGQDNDGRLILDLEGEKFILSKGMPGNSPVCITNGAFYNGGIPINDGSIFHGMITTNVLSSAMINDSLFDGNPFEDTNEYQKLEIFDRQNEGYKMFQPAVEKEIEPPKKRWEILDIR